MLNHHKLFIAGLALLLTGLLFIGPVAWGATNFEDGSTGGGAGEIGSAVTKPDLTITKVELSSTNPHVGETQTVNVYVKNLGASLTSGQGIDNWFASIQDLNWLPDDFSGAVAILAERQITAEHPMVTGETIVYRGQGIFTSVGEKTGDFYVDNANELAEENEDNNHFAPVFSVTTKDSAETTDTVIKDLKVTGVTPQSVVILWRTNGDTKGKVFYKLINPTTSATGDVSVDSWMTAEDKHVRSNHEVKLEDLQANKKYQFYVMSAGSNGTDVKSETKDFTTRPANNVEKPKSDDTTPVSKPDDKIGPLPRQIAPTDEVLQLRERVKKLQLRVSELEKKLLEREKSLAQPKDEKLTNQVKGKIVLDVEKDKGGNGEAWYVDPITGERFYLKDGDTAYQAMKAFGLGITSVDLQKIPIAVDPKLVEKDSDGDGLSDDLEEAVGTDSVIADSDADGYKDGEEVQNQYSPVGKEKMPIDKGLCQRLKGRVVIDVSNKGRAWYIDPDSCQRYYLRNGEQAYKIMRYRSTGITRDNLNKLEVGELTTTE